MANENNSRWWETYLVRYITGSVVGSVIVYVILNRVGIHLIPRWDDIKSQNLLVLAALGFAYCYLASAPITLLHAVRFMWGRPSGLKRSNREFVLMVALVAIIFALSVYNSYPEFAGTAALVGVGLFFVYYMGLDLLAKVDESKQWEIAYTKLVISREKESTQYIESYRHLREHGNAFFIVLLEVFFAVPLYMVTGADNVSQKYLLLFWLFVLWIIPGVICWFLGNKLERHMVER